MTDQPKQDADHDAALVARLHGYGTEDGEAAALTIERLTRELAAAEFAAQYHDDRTKRQADTVWRSMERAKAAEARAEKLQAALIWTRRFIEASGLSENAIRETLAIIDAKVSEALAPVAAQGEAEAANERDLFEEWAATDHRAIEPQQFEERTPGNNHYYRHDCDNQAYIGWCARAAQPKAPEEPVPVEAFVCSNPNCSTVYLQDPMGHCPACRKDNGGGWSTRRVPLAAAPALTPAPAGLEPPVQWLWYGREGDQTHISFGRWQSHPSQHRYKFAEIQPTEHDHPAPAGLDTATVEALRELERYCDGQTIKWFNLARAEKDPVGAKELDRVRDAYSDVTMRLRSLTTEEST